MAFRTLPVFLGACAIGALAGCGAVAADAPVHEGRIVAQPMSWMGAAWLNRDTRQQEENTRVLFDLLSLKSGQNVCDIGVGSGYHAIPMAKAVAPGTVYGVDIQPEMLDLLATAAKRARRSNVKGVLGQVDDTQLPPETCDRMLVVDAYHEFSHPVEMLASMRKALKPDGRLYIVEFRAEDPSVPIKPEHKMTKEQVTLEVARAEVGLKLVGQDDRLPWQHVLVFQRADGPEPEIDITPWNPPQ